MASNNKNNSNNTTAAVDTSFYEERTGRLIDVHGIGNETPEDRQHMNER